MVETERCARSARPLGVACVRGNTTCHEDLGDVRIDEERRTDEVILLPNV